MLRAAHVPLLSLPHCCRSTPRSAALPQACTSRNLLHLPPSTSSLQAPIKIRHLLPEYVAVLVSRFWVCTYFLRLQKSSGLDLLVDAMERKHISDSLGSGLAQAIRDQLRRNSAPLTDGPSTIDTSTSSSPPAHVITRVPSQPTRRSFASNHVCHYCQRPFTCSSNLKRHLSVHTGARPYKCEFCGQAFSNSSNRRKHERMHMKAMGVPEAAPLTAADYTLHQSTAQRKDSAESATLWLETREAEAHEDTDGDSEALELDA